MSRYGWVKSQVEFRQKHTYSGIKLPDIIDLSAYKPLVVNQLNIGRCTGCGIGGSLSGKMSQLGLNPGNFFYWSPDDLYNGARKLEGTLNEDAGAQPTDVYTWVKKYGAIPYSLWPISPNLSTVDPSTEESEAIMLPDFVPVQLDTTPANALVHLLDALAAGNFVTIGASYFAAWEKYSGAYNPSYKPMRRLVVAMRNFSTTPIWLIGFSSVRIVGDGKLRAE